MTDERLTLKEYLVFALAYFNKLDENGQLADTRGNRIRLKISAKLAGGEDKLDEFSGRVAEKVMKFMR